MSNLDNTNSANMDFLPKDYAQKRQVNKMAIVSTGLVVVMIGGIVGAWFFTLWKNKPIFDENTRVKAQYVEASKKIEEYQAMGKEREKMIAKAETTTTLMERVRRFALLEELTLLRPEGLNFTEIELKSEKASSGAQALSEVERRCEFRRDCPPRHVLRPTT